MKKIILIFSSMLVCLFSLGQTAQEKAKVKAIFIRQAKEMNQQCPMYLDELTTLTSVVFYNWTTTFNYKLNIPGEDVSAADAKEFINEMKQQTKQFVKDGTARTCWRN